MLKKIIVSIVLGAFLLVTIIAPIAYAQSPTSSSAPQTGTWYNQTFQQWHAKVYDDSSPAEIFGERYTAAQVQWVIYGFLSFLVHLPIQGNDSALDCLLQEGQNIDECADAIQETIDNLIAGETTSSDLNGSANVLAIITSSPVSGIGYLKNVGQRLNLIPEVEAQGFGFGAANPVLEIWRVSRDISYAFLVIAIVALAFMVMFRVKLSPQIVISAQSALPKVVIALILITFSYAIAGFLIDLMYLSIGVVALAFDPLSSFSSTKLFTKLAITGSVFWIFVGYYILFVIGIIMSILNVIATWNVALWAIYIVLLFFALISFIVLIWYWIKIIILLFKTFVYVLFGIIVAPLQILLGVVYPGAGIGSWLRNMVANLAVYPVIATLLLIAFLFLTAGFPDWVTYPGGGWIFYGFDSRTLSGNTWDPPLTAGIAGSTGGGTSILWFIASFATIAMIPKAGELVKSMIERKPFAGTAIGEALGPVRQGGGVAGGALLQRRIISDKTSPEQRERLKRLQSVLEFLKIVPEQRS